MKNLLQKISDVIHFNYEPGLLIPQEISMIEMKTINLRKMRITMKHTGYAHL